MKNKEQKLTHQEIEQWIILKCQELQTFQQPWRCALRHQWQLLWPPGYGGKHSHPHYFPTTNDRTHVNNIKFAALKQMKAMNKISQQDRNSQERDKRNLV